MIYSENGYIVGDGVYIIRRIFRTMSFFNQASMKNVVLLLAAFYTAFIHIVVHLLNNNKKSPFRVLYSVSENAMPYIAPSPEVIKLFSCSTQLSMKFSL